MIESASRLFFPRDGQGGNAVKSLGQGADAVLGVQSVVKHHRHGASPRLLLCDAYTRVEQQVGFNILATAIVEINGGK